MKMLNGHQKVQRCFPNLSHLPTIVFYYDSDYHLCANTPRFCFPIPRNLVERVIMIANSHKKDFSLFWKLSPTKRILVFQWTKTCENSLQLFLIVFARWIVRTLFCASREAMPKQKVVGCQSRGIRRTRPRLVDSRRVWHSYILCRLLWNRMYRSKSDLTVSKKRHVQRQGRRRCRPLCTLTYFNFQARGIRESRRRAADDVEDR
jgi:hypothetical protein